MNNDHIVAEYETYLRSWRATEATIRARKTLARSRLKAWGVAGFTATNIQAFLAADAHGNPRAHWTTATYHNHLADLCSFLVASGRIATSPMDNMRRIKAPVRKPHPLTELEVQRIMSVVEGEVRDWIVLALFAGLRAFEIAKIRGDDFGPEGLHVIGKGGKEATLPCHPELIAMTERYPATGYWFTRRDGKPIPEQRISMTVSRLFSSMGIEKSIHRCRHTYGTRLLRAGVNIRVVQRLMRHSSLETTAGYLAVVTDEERDAIHLLTVA